MKKRSIITTISAVVLAMATVTLAGCAGNNNKSGTTQESTSVVDSVTLVDFDNITATVELGSTYSLPNIATDTNGKDYQVVYSATDESGQAVAVNKNSFVASKTGVFTITAKVAFSDGKSASRTITLTVNDTTAPTVTIGKVKTGYIGVAYKLPTVTYEDVSGDCELNVKVFLTGTGEKEITVENNQFTPTEAGNYEVRATAKDASGNIGRETKAFVVKAEKDPAAPEEVIDFNDEDETCVRKNPARDAAYTFEILDEFENEEGVLKVTTSDDCTTIILNQMAHEKSHYAEYDNVIFRMFIPSDKRVHHMHMNSETSQKSYYDLDGSVSQIVYDEWHDYKFEASALLNTANDIYPNIFLYTYEAKESSLYIADISVEKVAQVSIASPATGTVGEEYTFHHMWMNAAEVGESYYDNGSGLGKLVYGKWVEYGFPIARLTEVDAPYISFYNEHFERWADIYVSDVRVTKGLPPVDVRTDEVNGFNRESNIDLISFGARVADGRNEFSWLETFENEYGVLKLHTCDDNPMIQLEGFVNDKEALSAYDKIIFKMFVDKGEKPSIHHIWMNNVEGESYRDDGGSLGQLVYGEWVELSFPIARLTEAEKPALRFYCEPYGSWANIYVADIRVEMLPTDPAKPDEVIDFDEEVDLMNVTYGDRPSDRAEDPVWLDNYEGEQGVLKVRTMDDNPRIRLTSYKNAFSSLSGYQYVVVKMWLEHKGANDYHHIYLNEEAGDMYYFNGGGAGQIYYEQWVDYSFPISELREGGFEVRIYNDNYGSWANIYVSDVRVVTTRPPLVTRADEVESFNSKAALANITYGDRPSDRAEDPVWLDNYEGEQGVLKVRTMDDNPRIRLTSYKNAFSSLSGYQYVVVKMWLEHKGANDYHHIYLNEEAGDMYYFNGGGAGQIYYEQWVEFSFPISELREGGFELRAYNDNYGSWANIYISDIRVTNERPALIAE